MKNHENNDDPLVSAILIAHNREKTLVNAIDSILQQTYQNIEIIIVENSPTARVHAIVESYIDKTARHFKDIRINEYVNGNIARNRGIDTTTGMLVAFLDDDDEWLPTKISKQVQFFLRHKEVGTVFTGLKKVINNQRIVLDVRAYAPISDFRHQIFHGIPTVTSSLMFKKDVLERYRFDENLTHWQEYDLLIQLSVVTLFAYIPEALTLINVNQKTKNRLSNQLNPWEKSVTRIRDKYRERLGDSLGEDYFNFQTQYLWEKITREEKNIGWFKSRYDVIRLARHTKKSDI
ncbi:MAG: glycosyltransferase family 2 protein [Oenococcus sp.]|uniref:glycosyltransferase family 2 protein n=1 Tax=Oenococcus sp. TaxID=1979414 RepID=UPI0039EBAA11